MNVYQEDQFPWLVSEKRLIERVIAAGKPTLGICLGAQLLAVVLGGNVTRNPLKEIGWFPVQLTPAGRATDLFREFPEDFTVFHWHADRFSIPRGAIHVAGSVACAEQAFVYNGCVVGLQFHLEFTAESIAALVHNCRADCTAGRFVQDPAEFARRARHLEDAHVLLHRLLDRLAAG